MSVLSLAIPSKGRLKEKSEEWLKARGFEVRQIGGERGYQAEISGLGEVDMRLLSAREIAQGLIDGSIHAGVTGEDLLQDLAPTGPEDFHVLERLGFGGADVIVAVPQAWIDVDTMSDLEAAGAAFRKAHHRRLRVATKYMRLTRRFFAAKSVGEYRLVESGGNRSSACHWRSGRDCRHHFDRRDAQGERAENCFRWNNIEKRGRSGGVCKFVMESGCSEVPVTIGRCSKC